MNTVRHIPLLKEARNIPGCSRNHQILDLISTCGRKAGRRKRLNSSRCLNVFKGHTNMVKSAPVSPDGRYAISGCEDNTLKLWELDWDWEFPEEEASDYKKERLLDTKPIKAEPKEEVSPKKAHLKEENPPSYSNASILSRIKTLFKR